jgi:hypothetical protein
MQMTIKLTHPAKEARANAEATYFRIIQTTLILRALLSSSSR